MHAMTLRVRVAKCSAVPSGAWRSLAARLLWEQDAAGSNPAAPTNGLGSDLGINSMRSTRIQGTGTITGSH